MSVEVENVRGVSLGKLDADPRLWNDEHIPELVLVLVRALVAEIGAS